MVEQIPLQRAQIRRDPGGVGDNRRQSVQRRSRGGHTSGGGAQRRGVGGELSRPRGVVEHAPTRPNGVTGGANIMARAGEIERDGERSVSERGRKSPQALLGARRPSGEARDMAAARIVSTPTLPHPPILRAALRH